jgi:hypothetical protein
MTVLQEFITSIRGITKFDPEFQVAPNCILWPDKERQWESVIPRLQEEMPELFVLGEYNPRERTGPAIWLRCVLAGQIDTHPIAADKPPILYLPDFSRQDLRPVENSPWQVTPLMEFQYRGTIWSQKNSKDWTLLAFLVSRLGGLGLDIANDAETHKAMKLALDYVMDEESEKIRGKHLDQDYFHTLLTSGDPVRDMLNWLDDSQTFRTERDQNQWLGFVELSKTRWAFDPENEGSLSGAERLAYHKGPWQAIWDRFREAPHRYPHIPSLLRQTSVPQDPNADKSGWPQWNEDEENSLRAALLEVGNLSPEDAKKELLTLFIRHSKRFKSVWKELGDAPLASALEKIAALAEQHIDLEFDRIENYVSNYSQFLWLCDAAILEALASIEKTEDLEAVQAVLNIVYLPNINESANKLQKFVLSHGYPGESTETQTPSQCSPGECVFFIDGLRFDVAKWLSESLIQEGLTVTETPKWSALPTITATGKPAVTPVADKISGAEMTVDFTPNVTASQKSLKGGYYLPKLLTEAGWELLEKNKTGTVTGNAWTEYSRIDHEGHDRGWRLARYLQEILVEIKARIMQLLEAGWEKVRVVTDHGWLLLPGGLPKIELPSPLTDNKWGRCAVIKAGAVSDENLYSWYWNPNQQVALAPGTYCYKNGQEYTHGGLSFQECLTLELAISKDPKALGLAQVTITAAIWRGLRCQVTVIGDHTGLFFDIRKQPGNSSSSIVSNTKGLDNTGIASVIVENEDFDGIQAYIVIIDKNKQPMAQVVTTVGGEIK